MAVLVPNLSTQGYDPYNFGIAETYSYIPIANDQGRPIFAKAGYITNFSDLTLSLSTGDLNIGSVHILDNNNGLTVSIADVGLTGLDAGKGAMRVLSQDLDSNVDDITIGDKKGNFASVNAATSALNVLVVNPVSSVSVTNQLTSTTILNPVTAVTILNTVSAVNVVACNVTLPVSGSVTVTNLVSTIPLGTQLVSFADSPQLDANRRLRVALPQQSWWYVSSVDKDGDLRLIESTTPGASSIFVQNLASVTMTPGTSSAGSIVRASRRRFKVRPGVSHQWTGTVNFDGQDDGTIKRVGLFTNFNGMFFELSGSDLNVVVRRRLTDGTLVEERVNRNNFNGDKLDGNGPSGQNWSSVLSGSITAGTNRWAVAIPGDGTVYNTEFTYTNGALSAIKPGTKATISGVTPSGYNGNVTIAAVNTTTNKLTATYVIDPGIYSSISNSTIVHTGFHNAHTLFFEFNGGRTAVTHFGINSSYGPTYLHTFDFSNTLGLQYESAPALMDRKEVRNYKTLTYNPSMTIDGTAFTIEAESELNPGFVAAYNITPITIAAGKDQPILGIGLRTGEPYQRSDIQVQQMNVIDTANQSNQNNSSTSVIHWKLLLNPGLSGVPASTDIGKSSRQWAYTSSTSITAQGIELMSGFAVSQTPIDVKTSLNFLNMGSNIDYTDADKVILTARVVAAGSNASTVVASINAIEAL